MSYSIRWDIAKLVKAQDFDSCTTLVRIQLSQPKNPSRKTWIFSFVPQGTTSFAWHTQHHLSVSSTSLPPRAAQMNEVALRANDVLRNEVGLRPMMLRFAQTELERY